VLFSSSATNLPAATNVQWNAGDVYDFVSLGAGNWRCTGVTSTTADVAISGNAYQVVSSGIVGFTVAGATVSLGAGCSMLLPGRLQHRTDSTVASATTITLGTQGNVFPISGSTPVTGITTTSWQSGSRVTLIPASASITLGHNTSAGGIKTKTGAAVTPVAGMPYDLIYDGTNWLLI
jgi:hypothetical protein